MISLSRELAQRDAKGRRLLHSGDGWKLLLLDLRQGGEIPTHSAPGPITVHCLEGTAEFHFAGQSVTLQAGDLQPLDAAIPHSLHSRDGAVLLVHLRTP